MAAAQPASGRDGPVACLVSFRLGGPDGVSIVAATWARALAKLGFTVRTVAGEGVADRVVPGLGLDAVAPPAATDLRDALDGADLVVVANVCSLPLNPAATGALVSCLRGRRALLHHHDLPWQRARFADVRGWPPDDPAWLHVAINELSRRELAARGISAVTVYNSAADLPDGDRGACRAALGVHSGELLVLQPTRAIARKNVRAGIRMAEELGGTYWLTGPAEEGYGPELRRLLVAARAPLRHRLPPASSIADAYAASDVVVLPSTWEGFGLPLLEASMLRKPLASSDFPVARELAGFGLRWFPADDPDPLRTWLRDPDPTLLDHNHEIAQRHFSLDALVNRLAALV